MTDFQRPRQAAPNNVEHLGAASMKWMGGGTACLILLMSISCSNTAGVAAGVARRHSVSPGKQENRADAAEPPTSKAEVNNVGLVEEREAEALAALLGEVGPGTVERARDLAAVGNRGAILFLAYQLGHAEVRLSKAAALYLGETAGEEAAPVLIAALQDEHWKIRFNVALALSCLKGLEQPFVEVLKERFEHEQNRGVLHVLALALRKFGTEDYTQVLIDRVRRIEGEERLAHITILGKIASEYGDRSAIEGLVNALGDEDLQVREAAFLPLASLRGGDGGYDPLQAPELQEEQIRGWHEWLESQPRAKQ